MANLKVRKPAVPESPTVETPPVDAPMGAPTPWTTTSYGVMKRLHTAGILARNTFGQPLVFEYAPEERPRIEAVLGAEAMG